jgi:methionine synthase II (cobalamin-independent)
VTTATGTGSWPGTDVREALRIVRDMLGSPGEGTEGLPYLPELPQRGPGAELVGRGLGLLVDLPVDLQPSGWRLTDRPGRDLRRSQALMRQDLDELAEAYDGWAAPLKIQVAGPWTLAAGTWLPRGERVVSDEGAARDLADSLAEGVRQHVAAVQQLVPGAQLVLQVDEPSLPAVLEGQLPTASGFGRVRAVDPQVALSALETVLAAAPDGSTPVLHCCAPAAPIALLRRTGADLALDTSLLGPSAWEGVAVAVEDGGTLYAGCVPTTGPSPRAQDVAAALTDRWRELGLARERLADVVVTSACGLAGLTPEAAKSVVQVCVDTAQELAERTVT